VFLYGASGDGKSSLVNAGLMAAVVARRDWSPERIRIQPRHGEEIVVERIPRTEADGDRLPSLLVPEGDGSLRYVLSVAAFAERVREVCADGRHPLLAFDQFEEVITLFEDPEAIEAQTRIAEMLVGLLREPLAVKLLFVFREDYLSKVKRLLAAAPELVDQALHLEPLSADKLPAIVRGPFERFPGHYQRELDGDLCDRVCRAFAERGRSGEVALSEVQLVALRLWQSEDPGTLLEARGVRGLLEDELGEALEGFAPDLRDAAIAVLAQMLTPAGTRNVISADDLTRRVRDEDPDIAPALIASALARLESEARLVRRERRRDTYLYEIASEFLVPWISRRREELGREQARAQTRRRYIVRGTIAGTLVVLAAVVGVAAWVLDQRSEAQRLRSNGTALELATASSAITPTRPDIGLLLGLAAYRERPVVEARSAVLAGILATRDPGVVGILHGHLADVNATAFTPDGATLATASDDGTVRLWSTRTRRQLGPPLRGHDDAVYAVAFSPDGRTVASGGFDGTIRLWDRRTQAPLGRPFAPRAGTVRGVAFSRDGRTLATATELRGALLWDMRARRRIGRALKSGLGMAFGVAFSPDGRSVATAGDDGVELWDVRTQRRLGTPLDRHHARAVAFSAGGRVLAWGGDRGLVTLTDSRTRTRLGALHAPARNVTSVAFGPGGRRLAAAAGPAVQIWDTRSRRAVGKPIVNRAGDVASVVFAPDGRTLAYAGEDGAIRLWDPRDEHPLMSPLKGHAGAVNSVAFASDGATLASGADDRTIRLWDPRLRTPIGRPLVGHTDTVSGVAFAPGGRMLASSGLDGTIRLWDPRTQRQLGAPLQDDVPSPVSAVAFDPAGRTLAAAIDERAIELWDVHTRALLRTFGVPGAMSATQVRFSPDGATLASGSADGTIRLWDVAGGRQRGKAMRASASLVGEVTFSPDGRTLAAASGDGTIRLWDPRTSEQLGTPLIGHTDVVSSVAFSPDGRTIASASFDGTLRLWDARTHTQLGTPLRADNESVNSVAFSPDGRVLASGGADKTAKLWAGVLWRSADDLTRDVCDLLGDGLTRSEWQQHAGGTAYREVCG
jgi:WD40 repeat protein